MNQILRITQDCFEVLLENTKNIEEDEFLIRTLNFLRNYGMTISFKGFDKYKRPVLEVDGVLHTVDKSYSLGVGYRFIHAKHDISYFEDSDRYYKIINML